MPLALNVDRAYLRHSEFAHYFPIMGKAIASDITDEKKPRRSGAFLYQAS